MKFLKIELSVEIEMVQQVPETTEVVDLKLDPDYEKTVASITEEYRAQFAADGAKLVSLDVKTMSVIEV